MAPARNRVLPAVLAFPNLAPSLCCLLIAGSRLLGQSVLVNFLPCAYRKAQATLAIPTGQNRPGQMPRRVSRAGDGCFALTSLEASLAGP